MAMRLRCTFIPRAWIRGNAVEVDRLGPGTWEVEYPLSPSPLSDTDSSDALRSHPAAPEWVRRWTGPFDVAVEVVKR